MGIWTSFTGTIVFENQVEDDIYLMEDLIGRYSEAKYFKGTEISYHRQISNRQPDSEKYGNILGNKKNELTSTFKRQPNEPLSTTIRGLTLYSRNSDNIRLDVYKEEIKDIINGLDSIFPIDIATFVFVSDLETVTLTYAQGKFL